MKIQYVSDLHLEHEDMAFRVNKEADVIVLAGDITNANHLDKFENVMKSINGKKTFYVFGNHEHYGNWIENVPGIWERYIGTKYPNLTILKDTQEEYNGHLFVGGILWSSFDLYGTPKESMEHARMGISDFVAIRHGAGTLHPVTLIGWHNHTLSAIHKAVISAKLPVVVVTHFLPSEKSVSPRWGKNPINPYFASNCEYYMDGVKLWIHGHTHECFDYNIKDTRIVCNPRGYGNENPKFSPYRIVEI